MLKEASMGKYRRYDYKQSVMIPVSLEYQLMPGTLEFVSTDLSKSTWTLQFLTSANKMIKPVATPMLLKCC